MARAVSFAGKDEHFPKSYNMGLSIPMHFSAGIIPSQIVLYASYVVTSSFIFVRLMDFQQTIKNKGRKILENSWEQEREESPLSHFISHSLFSEQMLATLNRVRIFVMVFVWSLFFDKSTFWSCSIHSFPIQVTRSDKKLIVGYTEENNE